MDENESILLSIKKPLNIDMEDASFDPDLVLLINGEFMTLQQLGIGPEEGFSINPNSIYSTTWKEFLDDPRIIEAVKNFVFLRVRMIFDSPASSAVADSINHKISELEWRLNVWAEQKLNGGGEG